MIKARDDLNTNYNKLLAKNKDLLVIQSTRSIVEWDMETKMPPKGYIKPNSRIEVECYTCKTKIIRGKKQIHYEKVFCFTEKRN